MNYRHQYHAGNFADVWKHALLIPLIKGMQRKDKGFLFLDTHAGRGQYDLVTSEKGDSLQRKPEYPEGIGRLEKSSSGLPEEMSEYLEVVKRHDREAGNVAGSLRFYPGSPWIARLLSRSQDRLALCELHDEEYQALQREFSAEKGVSVQRIDGYTAVRAMLPPLEKRALVLIDPPFEDKDEFSRIFASLREAIRRMPSAVIAVWYPLTERAGADQFLDQVAMANLAPSLTAEVVIAGPASPIKMRGCGLLVVNPPWQYADQIKLTVQALPKLLEQEPGADGRILWLVNEK